MSSDGWEEVRLIDLADYQNGRATKPTESRSTGLPVVKIRELAGGITESTVRVDPELVEQRHLIDSGDLLFAWSASLGIHLWLGGKAALNQHIFRVTARDGTDQGFLRYLLEHQLRWLIATAAERQTTMGHVRKADLERLTCKRPPLDEQRAIAEVLGSLDHRISLLTEIARTCDRLRETIFQEVVLDSVERTRWPNVSLKEVCTTQYGFTASANEMAVGPQFVRVTDINKNPWVDWATTPFAEVPPGQLPEYALRPGDILVARMADPGKSALIDSEVNAVFASYLVRIRTRPAGLAQFVYGFLSSREYARYAAGAQYGTVQKNMNARVIVGCDMPLPPQDVIDRYSAIASALRARMAAALEEARAVAELRGTLLPKLVSGMLRIEHPERLLDQVA